MEKKFDAVVIGAGNGGLIAATTLAKKNQKVLLLEKNNVPGGFATSFIRGRFEFDPSLHELCDLGNKTNPGFVFKLFQELDIKVNWKPVPEAFQIVTKINDFRYDLTFPFGLEEFARKCEKYVPNSYESVVKFLKICQELKRATAYLQEVQGKPDSKYLRKHFPNYLTTAPYTLKEVLDQLKVPLLTQNFIEAYWSYLGIPSNRVSFTIYAIMFYEYIAFGAYIPTNRSNEISQAILTRFQALGGEVWFNTPAEEIIVENNRVAGVRTSHGVIKTNYVISNVSPHIVYGQLINSADIPNYDKKLVNTRKPGVQGFSVYLGLDISVEKLGLKCYSYFVNKDLISDKQFNRMKSLSNTEDYIVIALNNANKQASEQNTCILSFTTLFIDAWKNVTEKEYFKIKNDIASKMIKHFETLMNVNIREHIEEIEIATPVTFARYTGAINGAIYGYDLTPFDSTFSRSACIDADVNINGLRFCGGNSFRGHGYSTTYLSGNTMALKTFSEMLKDPELIAERQLRVKIAEDKMLADQKARALKQQALTEKQVNENEKQRILLLKNDEESRLKAAADNAKLLAETEKEKLLAKENAKNIVARIAEQKAAAKQLTKVDAQLELENRRRLRFIEKQTRLLQRAIAEGKIDHVEAKRILLSHVSPEEKALVSETALVPKKVIDKQKAAASINVADHQLSKAEKLSLKQQRKIEKQLANIERLKARRQQVEVATLAAQEPKDGSTALVVKKKGGAVEATIELTEQQKIKAEHLRLKQQRKLAKQNAKQEKKRLRVEQKQSKVEALTPEQTALLTQRQQVRAEKLQIKKERELAKQASKEAKLKIVQARQQANLEKLMARQVEIESAITNAQKVDINTSAVKVALEQANAAKPVAPIKQLEASKDYTKEELRAEKLSIKQERKLNKLQAKEERRQAKLAKKEAKLATKELARQNADIISVPNDNVVMEAKATIKASTKTTVAGKAAMQTDPAVVSNTIDISKDEIREELRKIKAERKLAKQLAKQEKRQAKLEIREARLAEKESTKTQIETPVVTDATAIKLPHAEKADAPIASKSFFGKHFKHEDENANSLVVQKQRPVEIEMKHADKVNAEVEDRLLAKQEIKAEKLRLKEERKAAKKVAKQERLALREQAMHERELAREQVMQERELVREQAMHEKELIREHSVEEKARFQEEAQQARHLPIETVSVADFKHTKPIGYSGIDQKVAIADESKKFEQSLVANKNIANEIAPMAHSLFKLNKIKRFGQDKSIYEFSDMIEYKIDKYLRKTYVRHNKLLSLEQIEAKKIASVEMLRDSLITNKRLLKLAILAENEKQKREEEVTAAQALEVKKHRKPKVVASKAQKTNKADKLSKTAERPVEIKTTKPEKTAKVKANHTLFHKTKTDKIDKLTEPVKNVTLTKQEDKQKPLSKTKSSHGLFHKQKVNVIKYSYEHAKVVEEKVKSLKAKKAKDQKITKVKNIKHVAPLPEPVAKKKVNRR